MRALSVCLALSGVIACHARDDHPLAASGSAAREAHEAPVAVAILTAVALTGTTSWVFLV